MKDEWLLLLLGVLLLLGAFLKVKLRDQQGKPLSTMWKVQIFLFPCLCLLSGLCLLLHWKDFALPVILLGILEEIVCWAIRRRKEK